MSPRDLTLRPSACAPLHVSDPSQLSLLFGAAGVEEGAVDWHADCVRLADIAALPRTLFIHHSQPASKVEESTAGAAAAAASAADPVTAPAVDSLLSVSERCDCYGGLWRTVSC